MFYVGIDVASQKHDCCVLNSSGDILTAFSFDNSIVGFSYLRDYLYNLDSPENIRIGL